jgi:hypothetical protein
MAVPAKKRSRGGRVPGISVPSTEKSRAASRTNAWKHGKYAKVVSQRFGQRAELERTFGSGAADVIERNVLAITGDDPEATLPLHAIAMSETEFIRRKLVDEVRDKGVLIAEDLVTAEGTSLGVRQKINPVLEPLRHFNEQLGHTADQLQITKKSRGEGAVNEAMRFRIERDAQLRQLDRPHRRALPPPAAEITDAEVIE